MDYIILYNPLSKGGSNKKNHLKIKKRLEKKGNKVSVGSLIEIVDVKEYIENLEPNTKIVIVGGDGTLHHLANTLKGYTIKNQIYVSKAGTGNDFIRSLKTKDKLIQINDYISDIPYDTIEELDNTKRYFLNSVGMGVDAYIAYLINNSKGKGSFSYFKSTYKGFMKYKPVDMDVIIDGEKRHFKKVWLTVIANSQYLGGGMNISPKSNRLNDTLEVVVIHKLPRVMVMFVFPLIYFGLHIKLKRWVKYYQGKEVLLEANNDSYVQYDGETLYPRRKLKVVRK